MEKRYLTTWDFAYKEIAGDCGETDWRRVDFQKDDEFFVTGNVIVYVEFGFPETLEEKPRKPRYSGKFVVRKIKQTIRRQRGIEKGFVVVLLEETDVTPEISKSVTDIIDTYTKDGGLIPLP